LNYLKKSRRLFKQKWALVLLVIVVFAASIIIILNYYTVRVLSAARAYINGESQFSKAQKDASAYLINYIYLENDTDFADFEKNIRIPCGDFIARISLSSSPKNERTAWKGFFQAKNHPEDIGDMIWLYNNFKDLKLFKKAIGLWKDADEMVISLSNLGNQSRNKIITGNISLKEKKILILSIENLSQKLTLKEQAFSDTLGIISRKINAYVFYSNVFITLVIIISALSFAGIMIRNLNKSHRKIIKQKDDLQKINISLDNFVFNVTHDLRSPLNSLLGLVNLIEDETDPDQIKEYTQLIKKNIDKQDLFIKEMLASIKSNHLGLNIVDCDLRSIIDDVITQNQFTNEGKPIKYEKKIEINNIASDPLKLQVIFNNLVSNAIKYSDSSKAEQWVKIKTHLYNSTVIIEVEDNGQGIKQVEKDKIFVKFYLSGKNNKSTGVGLFLVKEAIDQLNGTIEVNSSPGEFTKFTIMLPA